MILSLMKTEITANSCVKNCLVVRNSILLWKRVNQYRSSRGNAERCAHSDRLLLCLNPSRKWTDQQGTATDHRRLLKKRHPQDQSQPDNDGLVKPAAAIRIRKATEVAPYVVRVGITVRLH